MEICFWISVVGLAGLSAGAGAAPVAWSKEKFPSLLVLMYISFTSVNKVSLFSFVYLL